MHPSAVENLQFCLDLVSTLVRSSPTVLAIGDPAFESAIGPSFTVATPRELPRVADAYDVVMAAQLPSAALFGDMVRLCSPEGFLVLVSPSWRGADVTHDAYRELALAAGCFFLFVEFDERGPQRDVVGIFGKRPARLPSRPQRAPAVVPAAPRSFQLGVEVRRGGRTYLEVLTSLHEALDPGLYLEIGVHRGASLRLARCRAVAVDPDPRVSAGAPNVRLYTENSDDFFRYDAQAALEGGVDMAFVDGLHLFENALRDFMNIERYAGPGTVVVVDDVLPNHPVQALRERSSLAWTGDVWKLHDCLREYRPDLSLMLLDTDPTGLLLVTGLDPANRALWDGYNAIVEHYLSSTQATPPSGVISRVEAVPADSPAFADVVKAARCARAKG